MLRVNISDCLEGYLIRFTFLFSNTTLKNYTMKKIRSLNLRFLSKINNYISSTKEDNISSEESRVVPWVQVNGDKTLRLHYDLNEKSVCIDLGGYEGQWACDIFSMYCCQIHVFEPVPEYAKKIRQRFIKNPYVIVHEFGLAKESTISSIAIGADASSQYKQSENTIEIQLIKADDFFKENKIQSIDLMKINIEGGEYDLLDNLIETGLVNRIKNLQIQFHDFFPDASKRMHQIQGQLSETHKLTYQYEFVWENWTLK